MKTIIRALISLMLVCTLLFPAAAAMADEPSVGNLIHFIPTKITVRDESVKVEGYFVNLNANHSVKNFKDFKMEVYKYGDLLVDGNFGEINQFTIAPMGVKRQSFTFNGDHELNIGEYICDDSFIAVVECNFTSVEK